MVHNNILSNQIEVVAGKIEEIDIPELVDVIISEPMGYMLFNERMLETFLHAKKWLKPDGKLVALVASLCTIYLELLMMIDSLYNSLCLELLLVVDSLCIAFFQKPLLVVPYLYIHNRYLKLLLMVASLWF